MQKKELALRDMMLQESCDSTWPCQPEREVSCSQARSLAKKQEDVITALKAKQNWQKESLKWIEESCGGP